MKTTDVLGWAHPVSESGVIRLDTRGTYLIVPFEFGPRSGYNYTVHGKVIQSVIGVITKMVFIQNMGIVVVAAGDRVHAYSCSGRNSTLCAVVNSFADNEVLLTDETGVCVSHKLFEVDAQNQLTFMSERVRRIMRLFNHITILTEFSFFGYWLLHSNPTVLYRG